MYNGGIWTNLWFKPYSVFFSMSRWLCKCHNNSRSKGITIQNCNILSIAILFQITHTPNWFCSIVCSPFVIHTCRISQHLHVFQSYFNCSCIPTSTNSTTADAVNGSCAENCPLFYVFCVLLFCIMFFHLHDYVSSRNVHFQVKFPLYTCSFEQLPYSHCETFKSTDDF